tara:strand:- start:202 stop:441 length:240 start_codon:yes stop_codon:yes gene_type:complete
VLRVPQVRRVPLEIKVQVVQLEVKVQQVIKDLKVPKDHKDQKEQVEQQVLPHLEDSLALLEIKAHKVVLVPQVLQVQVR